MKASLRVLLALPVLLLVACGTDDIGSNPGESSTTIATSSPDSRPDTTGTQPNSPDRVPTTTIPPMTGEVPEDILVRILEDAADRADTEPADLSVIRDQAVEWPDGALGCPEPGQFYTQALVSGYWVEIEALDTTYDYRVDGSGNFRLCEDEILPPSQGGFVTPTTTGSDS